MLVTLPRSGSFAFLLCLAAAATLLALTGCDTLSEHKEVTVRKQVPASALVPNDCTATLQKDFQKEDSVEAPTVTPAGEMRCAEYFVTRVCLRNTETGELTNCRTTSVECTRWVYVEDDDNEGGGGTGGYPPGSGGGDECCANPPCQDLCYSPPGGGSEPVYDTTTVATENPCEGANPPDYCDEAGSCFDAEDIDDPLDREILEALENRSILTTLRDESNFGASNIEDRLEQGGWIVRGKTSGKVSFLEFPDSWDRSACGITPPSSGFTVPENSVYEVLGFVGTQPFEEGEDTTPVCGEEGSESYESGYSLDDVNFLATVANALGDYSLRGYTLDKSGITSYTPLGNAVSDPPYGRCGY